MEVRNVAQSPNFGMALKIKNPQETAKALKELPMDVVEAYKRAGDRLTNTRYYHVDVGPELKPQVVSVPGAYWGPYKGENTLITELGVSDNLGVSGYYGVSRLWGGQAREDGLVHHNIWSTWGPINSGGDWYTINAMADVATALDKAAVEVAKKSTSEQALEAAKKRKVAVEVDNLIGKFGVAD